MSGLRWHRLSIIINHLLLGACGIACWDYILLKQLVKNKTKVIVSTCRHCTLADVLNRFQRISIGNYILKGLRASSEDFLGIKPPAAALDELSTFRLHGKLSLLSCVHMKRRSWMAFTHPAVDTWAFMVRRLRHSRGAGCRARGFSRLPRGDRT